MTMALPVSLQWDKLGGLVPAVVQHADGGHVLMVGFMNADALQHTLDTGRVTFFSRTRQRLWTKGETSGNVLELVDMVSDCDNDTLLVRARPAGPVCHLGTDTCFGQAPERPPLDFFSRLEAIVREREANSGSESYTARLLAGGVEKIAQKVGEEAVELSLATVCRDDDGVLDEAADLMYHIIVALRARDLSLADVAARLEERHP